MMEDRTNARQDSFLIPQPSCLSSRRFRPYPDYKNSGVEWLGEIPAHWVITRVCDHAELINGFPFDSERFSRDEGIPLVRIRDLESAETEVRYIGPIVKDALIQGGDLLIGMDGDFNVARWRGKKALLNQRMCCLRPAETLDGQFLLYSIWFPLKVINDLTYATTVKHLSSYDIKKTHIGSPPPDEQRAIAAFLDKEIGKIDALVAKKERLIDLLREKRTALITHAVTKGLDPDVPMKDSGVEWLGNIPAHWKVVKLKRIAEISYGIVLELDRTLTEVTPIISLPNVSIDGELNLRDIPFTPLRENEREYLLLKKGDLLFNWRNGSSDHVGKTALFDAEGDYTHVSSS